MEAGGAGGCPLYKLNVFILRFETSSSWVGAASLCAMAKISMFSSAAARPEPAQFSDGQPQWSTGSGVSSRRTGSGTNVPSKENWPIQVPRPPTPVRSDYED